MMEVLTLQANKLDAGFAARIVLSQATIQLSGGEIVAVGGPNGAGKSTLIKTMARQLKPISGNVTIGGAEIWAQSPAEFARQLAYVPQSFDGNLELTVEEMVMLGRNPHQKWWQWQPSEKDRESSSRALHACEIADLKDKLLSQLSGGEKQRAAIATALAQEPKFLLLDEPTSNLDFKHQLDLLRMLHQLRNQGLGIMLVLHDLNMMAKVADRVILVAKSTSSDPSHIAFDGKADEILTSQNLKRIFEIDIQPIKDPVSGETHFNPFSTKGSEIPAKKMD